jgi:biopolymer transport protein ExbB
MSIDTMKAALDYLIFGALGIMSVLMVWFAVERWLFLRSVDVGSYSHPDDLNLALTRHMTVLYTVGANAPYVGLLGTVLAILITFYDLGHSRNLDPSVIMLGLALALKATAVGLAVAIPAILFYNGLSRKVEERAAEWRRRSA